jgi:hypothetical protein
MKFMSRSGDGEEVTAHEGNGKKAEKQRVSTAIEKRNKCIFKMFLAP